MDEILDKIITCNVPVLSNKMRSFFIYITAAVLRNTENLTLDSFKHFKDHFTQLLLQSITSERKLDNKLNKILASYKSTQDVSVLSANEMLMVIDILNDASFFLKLLGDSDNFKKSSKIIGKLRQRHEFKLAPNTNENLEKSPSEDDFVFLNEIQAIINDCVTLSISAISEISINKHGFIEDFDEYINKWILINKQIGTVNQHINIAWKRFSNQNDMGADDLLPLIVTLLPNNKASLTQANRNLTEALTFIPSGSLAYMLTTLAVATEAKISIIDNSGETDQTDTNDKIAAFIAEDIKQMELVDYYFKLLEACNKYKKNLSTEIYNKLSTENKEIYYKYSNTPPEEVANLAKDQLIDNPMITSALNTLLQKMIRIEDLLLCLTVKDRPVKNVLILFAAKYEHHKSTLIATVNMLNGSAANLHTYYMTFRFAAELATRSTAQLLPISTIEGTFHQLAEQAALLTSPISTTATARIPDESHTADPVKNEATDAPNNTLEPAEPDESPEAAAAAGMSLR